MRARGRGSISESLTQFYDAGAAKNDSVFAFARFAMQFSSSGSKVLGDFELAQGVTGQTVSPWGGAGQYSGPDGVLAPQEPFCRANQRVES